jgi:hypothetical protein
VNLRRTQKKLEHLLKDFAFAPVRQVLANRNLRLQTRELALVAN